jgi:hypothetical protein
MALTSNSLHRSRSALTTAALVAAILQCSCTGSSQATSKTAAGTLSRPTEITHEDCDIGGSGSERMDVNGDGKADVTLVKTSGREVCRAFDFNFDGLVDSWVYRDTAGQTRRKEADYDRDGTIDEITIYQGGVPLERYASTALSNRLDTWQFFTNGVLAKAERDSDGDNLIDQWWEYPKSGCPLVHTDLDGDGRPDPGATIDYCKETGYVPPERDEQKKPSSPDFSKPEGLPTELETKPMDPPAGGEAQPEGKGN